MAVNGIGRPITPLADRFWTKVERGEADECWLWTGARHHGSLGYGKVSVCADGHEGTMLAHRAAWFLAYGPIPDGMCVLHSCDVPLCVNPSHLWLGSQADNLSDMRQKGRWSRKGRR